MSTENVIRSDISVLYSLVRKIIVKPNEYSLLIEDIVGLSQDSKGPRQVVPYLEIVRDSLEMGVDESRFATYTYLGPVFSTDVDSFNKISFSLELPLPLDCWGLDLGIPDLCPL